MTDYLSRLLGRSASSTEFRPRPISRFEPDTRSPEAGAPELIVEEANRAPESAAGKIIEPARESAADRPAAQSPPAEPDDPELLPAVARPAPRTTASTAPLIPERAEGILATPKNRSKYPSKYSSGHPPENPPADDGSEPKPDSRPELAHRREPLTARERRPEAPLLETGNSSSLKPIIPENPQPRDTPAAEPRALSPAARKAPASPDKPLDRSETAHEPEETVIHVRVGRIDVRAVAAPSVSPPARPAPSKPMLTLEEYAKERSGGHR